MRVFVNEATGDVLTVCEDGMVGAGALLALGYRPTAGGVPSVGPVVGAEPVAADAETADVGDVSTVVEALPVPNAGASRAQWAAYAQSVGLDVDGLRRDEIRARVSAAAEG